MVLAATFVKYINANIALGTLSGKAARAAVLWTDLRLSPDGNSIRFAAARARPGGRIMQKDGELPPQKISRSTRGTCVGLKAATWYGADDIARPPQYRPGRGQLFRNSERDREALTELKAKPKAHANTLQASGGGPCKKIAL